MTRGFFVTATGTNCGKTFVARGLARALSRRGTDVAAIKPCETGLVDSVPADAVALARACGRPSLATAPGLFRARLPLAPYAACLEDHLPFPSIPSLAHCVRQLAAGADVLLVEGAGGLLVPIDSHATLAELAVALQLPLLVVAPDRLGVISHVLTLAESAALRRLQVAAVILSQLDEFIDDYSQHTNRRVLAERLQVPVRSFPISPDADDALADAAEASGLTALLGPS